MGRISRRLLWKIISTEPDAQENVTDRSSVKLGAEIKEGKEVECDRRHIHKYTETPTLSEREIGYTIQRATE